MKRWVKLIRWAPILALVILLAKCAFTAAVVIKTFML